jgi:hypothetical protein
MGSSGHYIAWSEQQKIEFAAPEYLRNAIQTLIRSRSKRFGVSRCGGQVLCIFGSTTCVRRTPRASAQAEWPTSW